MRDGVDADVPLDVVYSSRAQVRPLLLLSLFPLGYLLFWRFGNLPTWLAITGVAVFTIILLFGIVQALRSHSAGTVLRLDEFGVTVRGSQTVPWRNLQEMVVGPMRPAWLVGSRRNRILVFVPKPGIRLPGPPTLRDRPQAWGEKVRLRFYGSNLTVPVLPLSVTVEEVAGAAEKFGGLRTRTIPFNGIRRALHFAAAALVLGVLAGFIGAWIKHL